MYYHFRKTKQRYNSYAAPKTCHFCDPAEFKTRVAENTHAYIIPNRTFYDQWELSRVLDHLLLVPKDHVIKLAELTKAGRQDIIDLIAQYEAKGYEVYARSPVSGTRSVAHQHTHLIKTDHRPRRGMFYMRRPYILWLFR